MNRTILDISSEIGSGITPLRSKAEYWNSNDIPWVKTEQLGEYQIFDANEYISKTALKETTIKLWPPKTVSVAMYVPVQNPSSGTLNLFCLLNLELIIV